MHSIRWPLMGHTLSVALVLGAAAPALADEAAPNPAAR